MSLDAVRAWLDQAERDAAFAGFCREGGYWTEAVVAAEQAIEKRLKALLLAVGGRIDSTHQIHKLYANLVQWGVVAQDEAVAEDMRELFKEYQVSRYPMGESPEAPYRLGSERRAQWALDAIDRLWRLTEPAVAEIRGGTEEES